MTDGKVECQHAVNEKSTCQHIMKWGNRKGEVCGTGCVGDKCFRHKDNVKKQKQQYHAKSKTQKKNLGCAHIMKHGGRKGKRCGAKCRGNYCCNHKPKLRITRRNYHQESIKKAKIRKYSDSSMTIQNLRDAYEHEKMKLQRINAEAKKLINAVKNLKISMACPQNSIARQKMYQKKLDGYVDDRDLLIKRLTRQQEIADFCKERIANINN